MHIVLDGAKTIAPTGKAIVLKGESGDDTNSLANPRKIAPVEEVATGLSADFTRSFPAFSVTVLEVKTR